MKTENIVIPFNAEKLSAINIYIKEKGLSLEDELQKSAEALYAKHVPANVRAYIDAKSKEENTTKRAAKPSKSEGSILKQEKETGLEVPSFGSQLPAMPTAKGFVGLTKSGLGICTLG